MLEAHIVSSRGSLYYAGDTHPYDLEMLWEHVRGAGGEPTEHDVHIELLLDGDAIPEPLSVWIHNVAGIGAHVQILFTHNPRSAIDLATIRYAS